VLGVRIAMRVAATVAKELLLIATLVLTAASVFCTFFTSPHSFGHSLDTDTTSLLFSVSQTLLLLLLLTLM
jgi:hypothetical protein